MMEVDNTVNAESLLLSRQHGTSSSSLLYEIVAMEEDRDLQAVATDILARVGSRLEKKWTWMPETQEKLCSYLQQDDHNWGVLFPADESVLGFANELPTSVSWFWIFYKESQSENLVNNLDELLFQAFVDTSNASEVLRKFSACFTKSLTRSDQMAGLKHFWLIKLQEMVLNLCPNNQNRIFLPDEDITGDCCELANDVLLVDRLERLSRQWIDVLYDQMNLSNEDMESLNSLTGIESEIYFWEGRNKTLEFLQNELKRGEIVMGVLKAANSVYWVQLNNQTEDLNRVLQEIRLNLKLLRTLSRSLAKLRSAKLEDIPAIYDELLDRAFVVGKHAPGYKENAPLSRLVFQLSEELIAVCRKSLSVTKPFQGKINQCNEALAMVTRCVEYCISLYFQTITLLRRQGYENLPEDHTLTLANLHAFQTRLRHLKEICVCQQQLGRYSDGKRVKLPVLGYERQSDVHLTMTECDEKYGKLIEELSQFHEELLDIYSITWPETYEKFIVDTELLEIKLVDALEQGLERSRTLVDKMEIFFYFKHLYERTNVAKAMDRLSREFYIYAKNEVKTACRQQKHAAFTSAQLNQPSEAGRAMNVQRLRGYLEKIALVLQRLDWLGPQEERGVVLSRIKKWRQVLADGIKEGFLKWSNSGVDTMAKILESSVLSRHVCKPEWLQPNLDRTVFHVVQSASYWDRLLLEVPQDVQFVWQTRGELRVLHQLVLTLATQYNMLIKDLTPEKNNLFGSYLKRVFTTIHPGLSQITWNQPPLVKKYVQGCFAVLLEIEELLNNCKLVEKGIANICDGLASHQLVSFLVRKPVDHRLLLQEIEKELKVKSAEFVEHPMDALVPVLEVLHGKLDWQNNDTRVQWQAWMETLDNQIVQTWEANIIRCLRSLRSVIAPKKEDEEHFITLLSLKVTPLNSRLILEPSFRDMKETVSSLIDALVTLPCPVFQNKTYLLASPRLTPRSARNDPRSIGESSLNLSTNLNQERENASERITLGLRRLAYEVKGYLRQWMSWKVLWNVDVDVVFQTYIDQKPDVLAIASDYLNHKEVSLKADEFDPFVRFGCLSVDFASLKTLAADNADIWDAKFSACLKESLDAQSSYEEAYAITLIDSLTFLGKLYKTKKNSGYQLF